LAQAHAETDELFGEICNSYDKEGRRECFEQACARLDVDDAGDRMHAVGEEMKPLARAIVASPATSMEALRAKALVTFWQIAPLCAGHARYDFDDEYHFQMLFSAVAEFCGLMPISFGNWRTSLVYVTKMTRRKRDDHHRVSERKSSQSYIAPSTRSEWAQHAHAPVPQP
jgi:hypothetical protein